MRLQTCIIGSGSMLKSCIDIARRIADPRLVVLKEQPEGWHKSDAAFCAKKEIPCHVYAKIRDSSVASAIALCQPDLIVSVQNPDILPDHILRLAPLAINFHAAPLPRYAGLNPFSWAILNGETEYGVTWHVLASEIDAGNIVEQRFFPIDPAWTVVDLIKVSSQIGCESFEALLEKLAAGRRDFRPQDLEKRTYFSGKTKPFGGKFPFLSSQATLEKFRRATAFFPGPNLFCTPKVVVGDVSFEIIRFELDRRPNPAPAGTITAITDSGVSFAAAGITVTTDIVRSAGGNQMSAAELARMAGLAVGDRAALDRDIYAPTGS